MGEEENEISSPSTTSALFDWTIFWRGDFLSMSPSDRPPTICCFFCSTFRGGGGVFCSCVESSFLPLPILSLGLKEENGGCGKQPNQKGLGNDSSSKVLGRHEEDETAAETKTMTAEEEEEGGSGLHFPAGLPVPPFPLPVNHGQYTKEQRLALIQRYREKKKRPPPSEDLKVRYLVRSKFAKARPRIGGRFVATTTPKTSTVGKRQQPIVRRKRRRSESSWCPANSRVKKHKN